MSRCWVLLCPSWQLKFGNLNGCPSDSQGLKFQALTPLQAILTDFQSIPAMFSQVQSFRTVLTRQKRPSLLRAATWEVGGQQYIIDALAHYMNLLGGLDRHEEH